MIEALTLRVATGLSVRVTGTIVGWDPLLLSAYVPGVEMVEQAGQPELVLELRGGQPDQLLDDDNRVELQGPWQKFPMDAYHLLYGMVRRELLKRGYCVGHAACVGGILLAGHAGAGKTTVSLKLMRDHGWRLAAGNKAVIDATPTGLRVVAGTQTVTLRQEDAVGYGGTLGNGTPYGDRMAFRLPAVPVDDPMPLRALVLMRLNDGAELCTRLTPASALHTFYPLLRDAVNADVVVGDGVGVLSGAVPPMAKALAGALETLPAYVMVGSLAFVTEQVSRL